MSMLAEKKRKTKYVINPTKRPLWTTDSSGIKFSKELMEKMGWSAGKGLGANEQGIQEPLRVSYKNDNKGMGFKGNEENWIKQQDEFNFLLSQLANNTENNVESEEAEKNKVLSLEEKSKLSRARVHYQKFIRGKDLSKYSENDLSCILGSSKMKKANSEDAVEKETLLKNNVCETSFGVTTINSGSITEYFKKKWTLNNLKSENVKADQSNEVSNLEEQHLNKETHTILERKSNKRHKKNKEESLKNGSGGEGNENEEKERKKHKKKRKLDSEGEIINIKEEKLNTKIDIEVQKNEENQWEVDHSLKDIPESKKKQKKKESEDLKKIYSNIQSIDEKTDNKKKRKEKESEEKFGDGYKEEVSDFGLYVKQQNKNLEDYTKKKKKKLSEENSKEVIDGGVLEGGIENQIVEKKSFKKKKKDLEDLEKGEKEEEISKEFSGIKVAVEAASTEKKKKRKKEENTETQPEEVRKKSKKHKKEKAKEEAELKNDQLEANTSESQYKISNEKKHKTKSAISGTVGETENEMSDEKKEKMIKNGGVDFKSENEGNVIYTHKAALFKMKPLWGDSTKNSTAKALKLVCGANIEKFKGSNLGKILGYGYNKLEKNLER